MRVLCFALFAICFVALGDGPNYWIYPYDGYRIPLKIEVKYNKAKPVKRDTQEFSVLYIDLNNDGRDDKIEANLTSRGTGGMEYCIFRQERNGKFKIIEEAWGFLDSFRIGKNGYYQLFFTSKSGMEQRSFSIVTFNPQLDSYESSRIEHHYFNKFQSIIYKGALLPPPQKSIFLANLEHIIRTSIKEKFSDTIEQNDILYQNNSFYSKNETLSFTLLSNQVYFKLPTNVKHRQVPLKIPQLEDYSLYILGNHPLTKIVYEFFAQENPKYPINMTGAIISETQAKELALKETTFFGIKKSQIAKTTLTLDNYRYKIDFRITFPGSFSIGVYVVDICAFTGRVISSSFAA